MKKIFYGFILFVLLLIIAVVFAANSSYVIKKVADKFAPQYDIAYDTISGNILSGVQIEGLQYADHTLAKSIKFSWNPARLLDKSISIYELAIKEGNVDVMKSLIASFETNKSSSSDSFDFSVSISRGYVTLKPFEDQGVRIDKVVLDTEDIYYSSDTLEVKRLSLKVDSNLTKIDLEGGMAKDEVHLNHLSLQNIDILAIQKLIREYKNQSSKTSSKDQNETNPFIPKYITVEKFHGDILRAVYHPVEIDHLVLDGKGIVFDIQKLMAKKGIMDLNLRTNLSNATYQGKVRNNNLVGKIRLTPNKRLFELYKLPLRKEAISDITIDLDVSKVRVIADIQAKAKHIFISQKGEYKIDIDSLLSHVVYDIDTNKLQVDTKSIVTTPHAKYISMTNTFLMDNNITYGGEFKIKEFRGIDANYTKPFNNFDMKYSGDLNSIETVISTEMFKGSLYLADFKKGSFHLESKKEIELNEILALPEELNGSKVNVVVDAPIDFDANVSVKAKMLLTSNVANVDADISYGKTLHVKSVIDLPEKSLLKSFSKEVYWDKLSPIMTDMDLVENEMKVALKAAELRANVTYSLSNKKLDGIVRLESFLSNIEISEDKEYKLHTKIRSIQSFMKTIESYYAIDVKETPPLDGSAELKAQTKDFSTFEVMLNSPKLTYSPDRKTEHIVTDVNIVSSIESKKITVENYKLTYDKQTFFSTKPSVLHKENDLITIPQFWLNDQLSVEGKYDLNKRQGDFKANASKLHLEHEYVDLDSEVHLTMVLDGNKTSVNGNIVLLDGNVHYDLRQKTFATDDDIIIVQDMKKNQDSLFMDNLSVSIKVETKRPLVYKQKDIDIKANVHLGIYKTEQAPLMILGSIELPKEGTYIFRDKAFVLNKSYIYFTGDFNKPILDASFTHKSLDHLITATVTGSLALPNITFSSTPSLTREEILSIILFDSKAGAGTNSGEEMMKMMGGAMAKSVLSNLGLQLDHLVLGEGNSIEVGKKLTEDIIIIYVKDEIPVVKLKYEHGKRTESVISVSEESQSYDIIYKKDF